MANCSFKRLSFAFAVLICSVVYGQLPDVVSTTLANCVKVADYKYCNKDNKPSLEGQPAYEGYGYCCNIDSNPVECNDSLVEGLDCTMGDVGVQGEPIYRTYWTGIEAATCNTTDNMLTADTSLQLHIAN